MGLVIFRLATYHQPWIGPVCQEVGSPALTLALSDKIEDDVGSYCLSCHMIVGGSGSRPSVTVDPDGACGLDGMCE